MSNIEKLEWLTRYATNFPDQLEELKSRLLMLLTDIDMQIERKRPGYLMDIRLGTSRDTPINLEDKP